MLTTERAPWRRRATGLTRGLPPTTLGPVRPETRYTRSGDVHLAYQVFGEGSLDIVIVPSWVGNVEHWWDHPAPARFFRRLADFARVILFDGRGIGLSDPGPGLPTLEDRVDDVLAVMDAVDSSRAALFGEADAAAVSILAAASHPERVESLVFVNAYATSRWQEDYPWAPKPEERAEQIEGIVAAWGQGGPAADFAIALLAPTVAGDESFKEWWVSMSRQSTSPGQLRRALEMNADMDVRPVLGSIKVPTLVLHRQDNKAVPVENARYLASHVPGAKLVELEGADHLPFTGDVESLVGEVEEFLTGTRGSVGDERVLATILFTDIVDSTRRASELGDRRWRELLDTYDDVVRRQLERFRGRPVKATGDGHLATFDGPARAIHCTRSIAVQTARLGLQLRAGIHTGECEMRGDDVGGIAVHVASRILGVAAPGEVMVSSTVRDLVVGSGIRFEDRGSHVLRGVPEPWRLLCVVS